MQKILLNPGLLILSAFLFMFSSCVDQGYDLNKDISLDINAGGDVLSIPVGNTDSIKLSDLIDESDMLVTDGNGQYIITRSDVIDPVMVEIDPVTIDPDEVELDPVVVDFVPEIPAGFGAIYAIPVSGTFVAEMEQTSTFRVSNEVPDELIAVRTIGLKENEPSVLVFSLDFEGIPSGIRKLTFDQFKISLPPFLVFSPDDQVVNGVLTLDGEDDSFDPHAGFRRTLTVTGFDFTGMNEGEGLKTEQQNGKNMLIIDVDNPIGLQGKFKITGTVNPDELQQVRITPSITVDPLSVAKLTGTVDPDIDPVNQSIALDLGDDADFLKDDASLDIHNPQILLTIGNTIGIPVDITMNLYAKDDQGNTIDGSRIPQTTLHVKAAEKDGELTETKLIISRQGTQKDGYETVRIEELSNLLQVVPDLIFLEMTANADLAQPHRINLTKSMKITGDYEVVVPLRFDAIRITYKDTIDGLLEDLSDVSDKIKNLGMQFVTTAENSIPLELALDVVPLDVRGKEIAGVTAKVSRTIAAGTGTETVKTNITIDLTANDNSLSALDALGLNIKAENVSRPEGGVPLNANQFVRLSAMSIVIRGGLNLDLND
ncbi:MAG: hypothetical protein AB2L24_06975 [Mangrovibacterium sp.]